MSKPRTSITPYQHSSERGFTLVELMVTLSIAAILMTMAVPSFTTITQNSRLTTQANQFVAAMNLARSEAVKRNAAINVTANGGNWTTGWTVTVAADGTEVRRFEALAGDSTLTSAGGVASFQYQASGRVSAADILNLCDGRTGETGRKITIVTTGHVATTNLGCS